MKVELVFAAADRQELLELELEAGTTAGDALVESGIQARFVDVDLAVAPIGIWGKTIDRSEVLQEGDRVEIYRSLVIDPKEARRLRAEKA